MFKVDRIQQARILPDGYTIPEDFSLAAYMGSTWACCACRAGRRRKCSSLFDAEAGRWVTEEEWHPSQRVEHLEDGRVLFQVRVVITNEFVKWILRYGRQVKVIEPAHLAETVRAEHGGGGASKRPFHFPAVRTTAADPIMAAFRRALWKPAARKGKLMTNQHSTRAGSRQGALALIATLPSWGWLSGRGQSQPASPPRRPPACWRWRMTSPATARCSLSLIRVQAAERRRRRAGRLLHDQRA